MNTIKKLAQIGLVLWLISLIALPAAAQTPEQTDESAAAWREDVAFLWDEINDTHPDPFRQNSEDVFQETIDALDAEIPTLTDNQILVRIMEVIAMLEDGHSALFQTLQPTFTMHFYPLHFFLFDDGVFLVEAPLNEDLVGAELVGIGETDTAQAIELVGNVMTHDNESGRRILIPTSMVTAEILLGTGIVSDIGQPNFHLRTADGQDITLNPEPLNLDDYRGMIEYHWTLPEKDSLLSRSHPAENFWWTTLDEDSVIYLQYNTVMRTSEGIGSVTTLREELDEALATLPVRRFILDMRYNPGGDVANFRTLLDLFTENPFFADEGNLIILTGRNTFSAAVVLSLRLEQETPAVFIGEATGGQPLMFENARAFSLPNSGLRVQISTRSRQDSDLNDTRRAVEPDIPVSLQSGDFFNNWDAALETALAYPAEPSAEQ